MQTEDGPRCIKKEYKNKTKFQTTTCQTISCVVMTQKKKKMKINYSTKMRKTHETQTSTVFHYILHHIQTVKYDVK